MMAMRMIKLDTSAQSPKYINEANKDRQIMDKINKIMEWTALQI